ncbi:MAG: LamG domain-containing protein [Chloroflexi bacterium]|nr:LamG domain-containing protein [Chloroflexota bacterium]
MKLQNFSDPGLVLHLPLNELDGAAFMSKDQYGRPCSVTGAKWTPRGHVFDGVDDLIDCGDVAGALADQLTVEIFINNITQVDSTFWIVQGPPGAPGYDWGLYKTVAHKVAFYVVNAAGTDKSAASTRAIATGNWYHIAGSYDGTRVRVFFNGEEDAAPVAQSGSVRDSGYNCIVGRWNSRTVNSVIGEARIYNRALTPAEVRRNYLATCGERW